MYKIYDRMGMRNKCLLVTVVVVVNNKGWVIFNDFYQYFLQVTRYKMWTTRRKVYKNFHFYCYSVNEHKIFIKYNAL